METIFKICGRKEELEESFKLRYEVFCLELRFLNPADFPARRLRDDYDKWSIHFIAERSGRLIGTARLITADENSKFLIEESVSLPPVFNREKTVEISRGAIKKECRKAGIAIRMLDYIYEFCKRAEFAHILAFANEDMRRIYEKLEFPFAYKGESLIFNGYVTTPLIITVAKDFKVFH